MTQRRLYSVAETLQVFNMGSYKTATADLYLNICLHALLMQLQ